MMTGEAATSQNGKVAATRPPARPAPMLRVMKPYGYITAYYAVIAGLVWAALSLHPQAITFAPIGGAAAFGGDAFEPVRVGTSGGTETLIESVKLMLSLVGSFVLMLPVTWICMGARRRKDVSQSFVHTILVLPLVITGIVHVVHNSLALAFSLAGIVAGVRFRHTLKDSADTTYLFTAIAVGVACGINAVEVAAIISVFFNYTVLGLWAAEFGEATTGKTMFSREWMMRKEDKADDDADDDDDEAGDNRERRRA
jgi:hypothetical protein